MASIQEIEAAVTQLSPEQLADFRAWFTEYETRKPGTASAEQQEWQQLAAQNLVLAYGDDEPDYTVADLQKANPTYRAS